VQSEGIQMELKVLHQHGWSIGQLAREFGLNWRTVKRAISSDTPHRYPQRTKPTTLTEAQVAHVMRRLAVCPTIRGTDLYRELCRGYHYAGSYPSFARRLLTLRPAEIREPEVRLMGCSDTIPSLVDSWETNVEQS
jgi:hypothetical protein